MLENLSLSRIARNPSESARPDLWPALCLSPCLGIQGSSVFDIPSKLAYPWSGSWDWDIVNGIISLGDNFSSTGVLDIRKDIVIQPPYTLFCKYYYYASSDGILVSRGLSSSYTPVIAIDLRSSTVNGFIRNSSNEGGTWGAVSGLTTNAWHSVAMVWSSATSRKLYVDGVLRSDSGTTVNGSITVNRGAIGCLTRNTNSLPLTLFRWAILNEYMKELTVKDIYDLHSDPLLPLRRKTSMSFYVPTGAVFKPFWCHNPEIIGAA